MHMEHTQTLHTKVAHPTCCEATIIRFCLSKMIIFGLSNRPAFLMPLQRFVFLRLTIYIKYLYLILCWKLTRTIHVL